MLASIIRTVVPLIVAAIVALLAKAHLDPGPFTELITETVATVVAAAYYAAVRWLEQHKAEFGWLLGVAKAPTYDATAKVDPKSPTAESAAVASPYVEDTPVETNLPAEGALPPATVDAGAGEGA